MDVTSADAVNLNCATVTEVRQSLGIGSGGAGGFSGLPLAEAGARPGSLETSSHTTDLPGASPRPSVELFRDSQKQVRAHSSLSARQSESESVCECSVACLP